MRYFGGCNVCIKKKTYSSELYHHGIAGQKWGERNGPPYPLNPAKDYSPKEKKHLTDEELKKAQEKFDSDSAYTGSKKMSKRYFKAIGANKEALKDAQKILKQHQKDSLQINYEGRKLFSGMRKDLTYLEATSEIAHYVDWIESKNMTMDDFAQASYMGIFEDGQQSNITAASMYAYKNNLGDKSKELVDRLDTIDSEAKKAARTVVESALDKIGDDRVKTIQGKNPEAYYSNVVYKIVDELDEIENNKGVYVGPSANDGIYDLYDGKYATEFTKKEKDSIKKAEEWVSNIKYNNSEYTWDALNEALEELNMGSKKCEEMTQSDWNRINNYIDKYYGRK